MNRLVARFLPLLAVAVAQIGVAAPRPSWSVDVWQSDDGLPNNNVTGLAQSTDGHLWIANSGNLARFDGASFEEFSDREIGLAGQRVTSVLLASDRSLWLGLDHGALVHLDGPRTKLFKKGLPNLITWSLIEDADGGIWGTYGGSTIARWYRGKATQFTEEPELPIHAHAGCSLARDKNGHIWLATAGCLLRFDGNEFILAIRVDDANTPIRIIGGRDGGLWGTAGLRVFHYRIGDNRLEFLGSLNATEPATEPTTLLHDQNGQLWIGTSSSGLFHQTDDGFEPIATSHARISSLIEDREGYVWVGTRGGGLNRIRPRAIDVENPETPTRHRQAFQSICEASDGSLWATTEEGLLLHRQNGNWSIVSANSNWPGGRATCVSADARGAVWIGTRNSRVDCWHDDHFTSLDHSDGLSSHVFHAILTMPNGEVWFAGEVPETLSRYRDGKLKSYPLPPGIRIIRAAESDGTGGIWVGTSKGVLLHIQNDTVQDLTADTTGEPLSIRCLHRTTDGTLWIGYVGGGVGRYKNGRFFRIERSHGLYDDVISQIVADGRGWLWFGAEHGLFKVRQSELDDVAEHRAASLRSIHYGRDAGLPSLQASAGDCPGALRSRDGRLWMPLRTGIAVIDPGRFRENLQPPTVLLKKLVVDDKSVAAYGDVVPSSVTIDLSDSHTAILKLPPGHRRLQFDFAAMTFNSPENIQFRYRLVGIDDGWLDAGTARHAAYSRLPAGDYRFEVEARSVDGQWSATPAAFGFSVATFFWQTWWFRLCSVALFTASIAGIGRYLTLRRLRAKLRELQQKAALNQERARIAKDIHDDLGGTMTQIILKLDLAQKHRDDPDQTVRRLHELSMITRDAVQSLDEIVWAANPSNDVLPAFIDYLGQFTTEYLQAANIRCRFDLPTHPSSIPIAPELRHNLFLVLKESLTNVVRHAHASEVRLQITISEQALILRITDNGRGFELPAAPGIGNGLRNTEQRMQSIGGSLIRDSKLGAGTTIVATLPGNPPKGESHPPTPNRQNDPTPVV